MSKEGMAKVQNGKNQIVKGSDDVVKMKLMNDRIVIICTFVVVGVSLIISIWQPQVLWIDGIGAVFKVFQYFKK